MNNVRIAPYDSRHEKPVLELSIRSWKPVFRELETNVPDFAYASFYPNGWQARQFADLRTVLREESGNVFVALTDDIVVGWVCVRIHPEDRMGEVYVLAVDPMFQRRGVGRKLLDHAFGVIRAAGMRMAMVETGDDPGHEVARRMYESLGFERWPVTRYFKNLA